MIASTYASATSFSVPVIEAAAVVRAFAAVVRAFAAVVRAFASAAVAIASACAANAPAAVVVNAIPLSALCALRANAPVSKASAITARL
ncbi:MAG: hypothetical protein IJ667_04265 [Synergistaceae bacterium]|nr:hypothetical protein [Synergistaceae bacterium]